MYLSDDFGLGRAGKWVHRRRPAAGRGGAPNRMAGLGAFGSPVFDVQCPDPPGCPPLAAADCRAAIRTAVLEAIRLANNAANRLQAAIAVPPASRDASAQQTASRFKSFFGHDPAFAISYAGNEESGVSVVKRFRAVANELNGGRRVIFHCRPTTDPCAEDDLTCCPSNVNAWQSEGVRNGVNLCEGFWNPPATLPAGLSVREISRRDHHPRDASHALRIPSRHRSRQDQSGLLRGLCPARGGHSGRPVRCLSMPWHSAMSVREILRGHPRMACTIATTTGPQIVNRMFPIA